VVYSVDFEGGSDALKRGELEPMWLSFDAFLNSYFLGIPTSMGTLQPELMILLNRLDSIIKEHEEVGDTDVREQMYEAVYHGFIVQTPGYTLPAEFGMFEPAGDASVRAALAEFIPTARALGISTPEQRFAAFQDDSVRSDAGSQYDEYFGHSDDFESLSAAMSRPAGPVGTPPAKLWWQFWK
jgi:hypothetical protein